MNYLEIARAARAKRRQSESAPTSPPALPGGLVERLLSLSLNDYRQEGTIIEIRVPYLDVTLFFVSTEREVSILQNEGVSRGRIWTATELIGLLSISASTPQEIASVAQTKASMTGEVVEIRPREVSEEGEVSAPARDATGPGREGSEVSEESADAKTARESAADRWGRA